MDSWSVDKIHIYIEFDIAIAASDLFNAYLK